MTLDELIAHHESLWHQWETQAQVVPEGNVLSRKWWAEHQGAKYKQRAVWHREAAELLRSLPVLYFEGRSPIGHVESVERRPEGLWIRASIEPTGE